MVVAAGASAGIAAAAAAERRRAGAEALTVVEAQLNVLKKAGQRATKAETSEVLRELCQELSDLATELANTWKRTHPHESQPKWSVEAIPEEELARIRWDFYANRVQQ